MSVLWPDQHGRCKMCDAHWVRELQQREEIAATKAHSIACLEALNAGLAERAKWKLVALLTLTALGMVFVMLVFGRIR